MHQGKRLTHERGRRFAMNSIERQISQYFPRFSLFLAIAVLLAAAVAAACGSASTNVIAPTAQKCQISVSDFTRTFGPSGGSGSATVTAERECSWTAATQAAWITVATAQGTGNGTLTFTVAPNQVPQGRSGALAVNNEQLTVSQEAAPCRFVVSPTALQIEATGGTFPITVSTVSGCTWSAATAATWLRVVGGGNGSGSANVTVVPNSGPQRSDTVSVAGQSVTVVQSAVDVTPTPNPPPPAPGCSFVLRPSVLSFPPDGGLATVQIDTTGQCAWTSSTTATWLTISPATGRGPDTLTVAAAANATGTARSGSISLGGQVIMVTQDAAGPAPAPQPVQVAGSVSRKGGECPAITFVVNGVDVVTTADTAFVNDRCDKVKNGASVAVEGLQQVGQPLVATRVTILRD
jgi:hypothetical protein